MGFDCNVGDFSLMLQTGTDTEALEQTVWEGLKFLSDIFPACFEKIMLL